MSLDINASIHDLTYLCFDVETTGLSYENDRIVEIGAVKCTTIEIVKKFQSFVDIGKKMPPAATDINNITDKMLAGQPNIVKCLEELLPMLDDVILVAHHINFDFGFLNAELLRNGFSALQGIPMIDTVMLGKKIVPSLSNHKLNTLAEHYGIDMGDHHRALDDALTCRDIMLKCCDDLSVLGELTIGEVLV